MIFDRLVTFHDTSGERYDPKKHGYSSSDKVIAELSANITDLGVEKSVQLFGDYQHRALVIRTMNEPPQNFSYLTVDGDSRKYVLNTRRDPLKHFTLIVGETK